MLTRRDFLVASAAAVAAPLVVSRNLFAGTWAPLPVITVYKSPDCECCKRWVKHLNTSGFVVTVQDSLKMDDVKRTMQVPDALQSCHTAVVGRYIIEGHVPADLIKKLIAEKSTSMGLAVPGMPTGSPGMEGGRADHYDVIAFEIGGKTRVYARR